MPDRSTHPIVPPGTSCAFVQFAEMFRFPAHTVGHLNFCDALQDLGVDTTLYMVPPSDRPLPQPVELAEEYGLAHTPRISWAPASRSNWGAHLRTLRGAAKAGRHATFTYATKAMPTLGALLGGAPIAVHEIHQPSAFWSRNDRIAFSLARRSKRLRIVCISQNLAHVTALEWGLDESSIIVEHSGHNDPIRDDYRASNAEGRRLRAIYVGSFDPGKGIETIFELARLHPEVDFTVVGGARPAIDLPDNIEVSPRVPHGEVPDLLSRADVLLMPFGTYSGEGLPAGIDNAAEEFYSPLKMMEYLAAGRAIVASDLPSIAEVIVDGENGLLVEPDSVAAWSDALARLASDAELRERLAHGAAATAPRHTIAERARRILEAIGVAR